MLITGWGGGTKLLEPLKRSLEAQSYSVALINIFNALDKNILDEKIELAKDFDVIMGWSLGGQLATILANEIQNKHDQSIILITLGSNPCFVANEAWPYAMDTTTFQSFKKSFKTDAITTLKKFGYMVCQGTNTSKKDFIKLQSLIHPQNLDTLSAGLECLGTLNNVSILENYSGYQYHIFAKQDFLVSYKVARKLENLPAKFIFIDLISGSHGFPLFEIDVVTSKIFQFLKKNNQIIR